MIWNARYVNRPTRPRDTAQKTVEPVDLDPRGDADLPATSGDKDSALDEVTYERVSTVLGTVERAGNWEVADRIRARSVLGALKLDFREAELPPDGMIEIHCDVVLGEIELIVPRGAEVEMQEVMAVMGEVKHESGRSGVRPLLRRVLTGEEPGDRGFPGADLLFVVTGRVIMGGLTVKSRSD
ncbi:MAG: cell wall-active antibiotics response protein [bacterium]|nr:cell wall-active antibiotics response protein [bacterium]